MPPRSSPLLSFGLWLAHPSNSHRQNIKNGNVSRSFSEDIGIKANTDLGSVAFWIELTYLPPSHPLSPLLPEGKRKSSATLHGLYAN